MNDWQKLQPAVFLFAIFLIAITGCTKTLVQDKVTAANPQEKVVHCSGSESADNSSIAVLPIPVAAFFVPHADLNDIQADEYLNKCGESSKLVNRKVKVNKSACIPAGLTRIITLGIWQWCPANVSWDADIKEAKAQN